jgi:monoterpene epsilon-lactone hydrolase
MSSFSNKAFTLFLRVVRAGKPFPSEEQVRKEVAQQDLRPASYAPPRRLGRKATFAVTDRHGWTTYVVTPKSRPARTRVLYLHGGGYISEISPFHWSFVAGLAKTSAAEVTVPIYPLAPHGTATNTVATATDIAAELLSESDSPLAIMGDSAGGGLTLAVAEQLRDRGVQPTRIVLISPWLDATASDPRMPAIAPHDPLSAIPWLAEAGRIYADTLPVTDPRVSPLNGDLHGLAPMTMFSGTADILNVDAHRLVEKAEGLGVTINFHETPGAQHVYPLLPTREGKAARMAIAALLAP